MSLNLWYWSGALINLGVATGCAFLGWREIRRGRREIHRKWMNAAVILVLAFLVSYPLKLIFLGKEDLLLWSHMDVTILRIHETFVLLMVLSGGAARWLARRLRVGGSQVSSQWKGWHRWCGRMALGCSAGGLLTAALILLGMVRRIN